MGSKAKPEQSARATIDARLAAAGWVVQDRDQLNLAAGRGVAVREFPMEGGFADYLLFVDGKPAGALEAKPEGHTLSGVERQAQQYTTGLPHGIRGPVSPLPFLYLSSGSITRFTNLLDPKPRSREVFAVHQPETLAEWLAAPTLDEWVRRTASHTAASADRPSSLRARLQTTPELEPAGLRPNQFRGILGLERSLREDRPRALIQMATGSGKTVLAIAAIYRLIKFGGARRVLFLVDRKTLGEQAETEFANWETPDDHRKLKDLYGITRLTSQTIPSSAKIVITTVQRLYSILKGEPEFDDEQEEHSRFTAAGALLKEPLPVVYSRAIPPEFFDVLFVDECHRSIYTLWRQVLEYFDATLCGLTATPAKHTLGFFDQNLVMEYGHTSAVADGVNVDYDEYRIKTRISRQGSTIEASLEPVVGKRDKRTRKTRWEASDEDITYDADALDRRVVAKDQIRTIARAFRERFLPECFPERAGEVPKTLVFAKDDSHAEDIVGLFRLEFGEGNDFCQKITYRSTGKSAKELIQDFRVSYYPRIAVTVDMIATGTDIRPIEVVFFLRAVKSRVLFEQMKGRGSRICDPTELRAVSPKARHKTRFVIVDAVGVTECPLEESGPLERNSSVPLKSLLEHVAMGGTEPDVLSSLASRLARLDKACDPDQRERVRVASGGAGLAALSHALLEALDPDRQQEHARTLFGLAPEAQPMPEQEARAAAALLGEATRTLRETPALRTLIVDLRREVEQTIDEVSRDELLEAGPTRDAAERARQTVESFERYLAEHKEEIEALRFFYSVPARRGLSLAALKDLAREIQAAPRSWTTERLWQAYETVRKDKVRSAPRHPVVDLVSLVRFALHQDGELVPHAERVHERFETWLAAQRTAGRSFTPAQLEWLTMIRDHVASSLGIEPDDFDLVPFAEHGGRARASQVFGGRLNEVLKELNEVLAA